MAASTKDHEIILYHYTFSPYAKRVVWYLNLRKIPYKQCLQPVTLPRPDLVALGTRYRRIPILSIGRALYHDTRLILRVLTALYPPSPAHPSISPTTPAQRAYATLLESWAIDGGGFARAAQVMPAGALDEKFREDRKDFTGSAWTKEGMERGRPEALVEVRGRFDVVEKEILGDGRMWVGGTEAPGLLDIEAIWLFHWLKNLPGALPPDYISAIQFPKVFAWISRFDALAATHKAPKVSGAEALAIVSKGEYPESEEGDVEAGDPTGLRKGDEIEVWPIDSGFNHKDRGRLIKLDGREVVIETKTKEGTQVRIHTPRHGFRVRKVGGARM